MKGETDMVEFTSPKTSKQIIVLYTNHICVVSECKNYDHTSHEEVKEYD